MSHNSLRGERSIAFNNARGFVEKSPGLHPQCTFFFFKIFVINRSITDGREHAENPYDVHESAEHRRRFRILVIVHVGQLRKTVVHDRGGGGGAAISVPPPPPSRSGGCVTRFTSLRLLRVRLVYDESGRHGAGPRTYHAVCRTDKTSARTKTLIYNNNPLYALAGYENNGRIITRGRLNDKNAFVFSFPGGPTTRTQKFLQRNMCARARVCVRVRTNCDPPTVIRSPFLDEASARDAKPTHLRAAADLIRTRPPRQSKNTNYFKYVLCV